MVDVPILSAQEVWSEYKLEDGSTLRVRPVLASVDRSAEYTSDGEPIYNAKIQLIVDARVPDSLRKKP